MKHATLTLVFLFGLSVAFDADAAQAVDVSKEDLKIFLETRNALADPRVQSMPEARRIPAIAQRNFRISAGQLQAILDKVEGAGGPEAIAEQSQKAIAAALESSALGGKVQEVRVDASSSHVVTYVKVLTDKEKLDETVVLAALKAGTAKPGITETFYLWAVDEEGEDLFRGKIASQRIQRIQEKRISEWARTRYMRLFEVDRDSRAAADPGELPVQ